MSHAAISLDRTRIIYDEQQKSVSLALSNENAKLPYLAQGWLENEKGEKLKLPFTVLPPVQRIEPGEKSQLKVQALLSAKQLPADRESVYYFNLREIPPRSEESNTLQIALQTRIKMFYRPKSLFVERPDLVKPWQESITLTREGDKYRVHNPTGYFVTLVDASQKYKGQTVSGFEAVMIEPKGNTLLNVSATQLGSAPAITYVNDFGARPVMIFNCQGSECRFSESKM